MTEWADFNTAAEWADYGAMTEWADYSTVYRWQRSDDALRERAALGPSGLRRGVRAFLAALAALCFAGALGLWGCSELRRTEMADVAPLAALEGDGAVTDRSLSATSGDTVRNAGGQGTGSASGASARSSTLGTWADAESSYPGLAAWLKVQGSVVSTAVMQADSQEPDYYLAHNAWGYRDSTGMPYLDARSSVNAPVRVIYGHNLGWGSSERFSPLADAWQQSSFDELKSALWAVQGHRTLTFVPLCSLHVPADATDLLSFDLNRSQVGPWVRDLLGQASAAAPEASDLASRATEALVLVTCTNGIHPASERSVVVFVR